MHVVTVPVQGINPPRRKRRRVFMWFFLVIQLIFIIWIISAGVTAHSSTECSPGLTAQECADARGAGGAVAIGLIIALWAAADIILGITYAIVRWTRR